MTGFKALAAGTHAFPGFLPSEMLAPVEGDHLAGDRRGLEQEADCGRHIGGIDPLLEQRRPRIRARSSSSLWPSLCSTGPGAMAFTLIRGASACAMVCVAVHSADLAMV